MFAGDAQAMEKRRGGKRWDEMNLEEGVDHRICVPELCVMAG